MFGETISYSAAFIAGLLSFFSPCIFPLIPGYFSFLTGFSLDRLTADSDPEVRKKILFSAVAFVLGFSAVFIMMGASASFVGGIVFKYRSVIRVAGGIIVILLGVHLMGLIRIRGLEYEKRIEVVKRPLGYFGGFLVGMAFGAGWSPCIGPLLGSILIFAGSRDTVSEGILLLGIYSAGLAVPFIIISFFINYLLAFIKKVSSVIKYVNAVAGILLILIGFLLIADRI
ncbi:MAG: cytochrome c biogenesis protein CcdA [Desulfobacteraceae bacterium]|jgi:cytochrome c-type biogenesis protein|nr:MAG: cytochrome c biogenesis protein CcdA [Desulfobacteraceae bacterium]